MATIAPLVAKLILDNGDFLAKTAATVQTLSAVGQRVAANNPGVRMANETTSAVRRMDQAANGYLKTMLKIGSVAGLITTGVKAAFAADKGRAGSGDGGPSNLATAHDRLSTSVTSAYERFGDAFSKSAGLAKILNTLANVVDNVAEGMEWLGSMLGSVVGYLSSSTPVAFALVFAFKALSVAAGVLLWVLTKLAIRSFVIWLTGMSPLTILWKLAVCVGVVGAKTALLAVINLVRAASLRMWLAMLGPIALVAAAIYGAVKLYQSLTAPRGGNGTVQTAKQAAEALKKTKEAAADASKEIDRMNQSIDKAFRQAGMTAIEKQLDDLRELLKTKGVSADAMKLALGEAGKKLNATEKVEATKKSIQEVQAEWNKLQKAAREVGMTEGQKAGQWFKDNGSGHLAGAAEMLVEQTEKRKQAIEAEKDLRKEVEDAQFAASIAHLDAIGQKMAKLRKDGAGAAVVAQLEGTLRAAEAEKNAKEEIARLTKEAADLAMEAEFVGLSAAQKRVAILERTGKLTAEQLDAARCRRQGSGRCSPAEKRLGLGQWTGSEK